MPNTFEHGKGHGLRVGDTVVNVSEERDTMIVEDAHGNVVEVELFAYVDGSHNIILHYEREVLAPSYN